MAQFQPAFLALSAALALAATPPAQAAEAKGPLPPAVNEVIACTRVADNAARLACMDRAAAALQASAGSGEVLFLDRQAVQKSQRENFGLNRRVEAPGAPADPTQADFEVAGAGQGPDRHWVVVLKGGGRWRLTDDALLGRDPKPGSKAHIRKGALGRFFIEIDGQPGVAAARLN